MELWIRSQDKTTLVKTKTLVIEDNMIVDYYQKRMVLGEYKSEERALEVVDEIQRLMIASLVDKNLDGYGVVIYEMPIE